MSTVTTLPVRHTYTADDLATMPDDGNRYELIDGTLIVTPAPAMRHQRTSMRMAVLLSECCPAGLEVFAAPFDVHLAKDTVVQPDLLVARQEDLNRAGLPATPLLAVEILSPSTRLIDLNLKRARYEVAGCPSYWVIDPGADTTTATITAWDLIDDTYTQVGVATGEETLALTHPFPVEVTPAALVDPHPRR